MKNTYLIEGSIFGEGDVLRNRPRRESYTAITDCYVLKLEKNLFNEIMDEFDDFNMEVMTIAKEREVLRIAQKKALIAHPDTNDLDFEQLMTRYEMTGSIDTQRKDFEQFI